MFGLSAAVSELSQHGFKQTRQRLAVLEVMAGAQTRMSPAEVHAQARVLCPELGLPTVYRTLEVLDRLGIIRRVHMTDNCEGFAPASIGEGHHVVCVKCGRVAEFAGCNVSELIPAAMRQTGFHIDGHFLELMGTCGECYRPGAGTTGQENDKRSTGAC